MHICQRIGLSAAIALSARYASAQATSAIKIAPAESRIEHEFSSVVSVRELADGRVLVSDAVDQKIFVVDFKSKTVASVGRIGKGPGEYENPDRLFPIGGDSTLMVERRTLRWHVFHRTSLVKTFAVDDPLISALRRHAGGADSRGNVIQVLTVFENGGPGPESSSLVRANRRSGRVDTVTSLRNPRIEIFRETKDGRVVSSAPRRIPFSAGEETALFEDGWLAIVKNDPYRVEWIDSAGQLRQGVPLPWSASRVTVEDVRVFLVQTGTRTPGVADEREAAVFWMAKTPAFVPAVMVGGVAPLGDGNLLIRNPPTASNPEARYHVVDRAGRLVSWIAMAPGETIVSVSAKWAYVVARNIDGLQFLSRHPWISPQ